MFVYMQTSDEYAPITGTSIYSLLTSTPPDSIDLIVCLDDVSKENTRKIEEVVIKCGGHVSFIDAKPLLSEIEGDKANAYRGSYAYNMRLYIDKVLPDNVDRVLMLDTDTLITGNLLELERFDLGANPVAAVVDSMSKSILVSLGWGHERYFNSGVILADLSMYRKEGWGDSLRKNLKETKKKVEQTVFNSVFKNRITKLPLRFNVLPPNRAYKDPRLLLEYLNLSEDEYYSCDEIASTLENPAINHFAGSGLLGRPWESNCIDPYRKQWRHTYEKTPWGGEPLMVTDLTLEERLGRGCYKILPRRLFVDIINSYKLKHRLPVTFSSE